MSLNLFSILYNVSTDLFSGNETPIFETRLFPQDIQLLNEIDLSSLNLQDPLLESFLIYYYYTEYLPSRFVHPQNTVTENNQLTPYWPAIQIEPSQSLLEYLENVLIQNDLSVDDWQSEYDQWRQTAISNQIALYNQIMPEIIQKYIRQYPSFLTELTAFERHVLPEWLIYEIEPDASNPETLYIYYYLNGMSPEAFQFIKNLVEQARLEDITVDVDVSTQEAFEYLYKNWVNSVLYPKFIQNTAKIQTFLNNITPLESYPSISHTQPVITGAKYYYDNVRWREDNREITNGNLLDIMNIIELNYDVPQVAVNVNGRISTRMFEGYPLDIQLDLEWISPDINQLIVLVHTGMDTNKKSYSRFILNPESATLTLEDIIDIGLEPRLRVLEKAFEFLTIDRPTQLDTRSTVIYRNIHIRPEIMLDMILNEPLIRYYLHVMEDIKPSALKENLDVYFNLERIKARLNNIENRELEVNVTSEKQDIDLFLELFGRILNYYKSYETDIEPEYEALFEPEQIEQSEIASQSSTMRSSKIKRSQLSDLSQIRNLSRNKQLTRLFPELNSNPSEPYSRLCQGPSKQPLILYTQEERDEWLSRPAFRFEGTEYKREVLPYDDPKNPKAWLTCDNLTTNPFIGLKRGDDGICIPCCYPKYQSDKSIYRDYMAGKGCGKKTVKKQENITKIIKPLDVGRKGQVPIEFKTFLHSVSGYDNSEQWFLNGVETSPNSVLECVLRGLGDKDFLQLKTPIQRLEYLDKERKKFIETSGLAIVKQELWDLDMNEIQDYLRGDRILAPQYFYRLLEEYYDITLFILEKRGDEIQFQIPRFSYYPFRTVRNRHFMILFQNDTQTEYFSYDEISQDTKAKRSVSEQILFTDETLFQFLSQKWSQTIRLFFWNQDNQTSHWWNTPLCSLLLQRAIGQIIDNRGKLRAIQILHNRVPITVFVEPDEPLFLPIISELYPLRDKQEIDFGEATERSENGIWYGRYFLIQDTSQYEDLPMKPSPTIGIDIFSPVEFYKSTQLQVKIFSTLLLWLYSYKRTLTAKQFMEEYCCIQSGGQYDFSNVRRQLPQVQTLVQALEYLHRVCPTLVNTDKKIVLYAITETTNLTPQIQTLLMTYRGQKITTLDLPFEWRRQRYVKTFTSETEWNDWLQSGTRQVYIQTVTQAGDPKYKTNVYPIVFKKGNDYWILQNVEDGNRDKAVQVAFDWMFENRNSGYSPSPVEKIDLPVNVISNLERDTLDKTQLLIYNSINKDGIEYYSALLSL